MMVDGSFHDSHMICQTITVHEANSLRNKRGRMKRERANLLNYDF